MSDDIVKVLLESLTEDQKQKLVMALLQKNTEEGAPALQEIIKDEISGTEPTVNEDFTVIRNQGLDQQRKQPVRARKNEWVDMGENKDESFDAEKFEKMGRVKRRGKPRKKKIECHVCGKQFTINENLVFGEYVRCNRCTGK